MSKFEFNPLVKTESGDRSLLWLHYLSLLFAMLYPLVDQGFAYGDPFWGANRAGFILMLFTLIIIFLRRNNGHELYTSHFHNILTTLFVFLIFWAVFLASLHLINWLYVNRPESLRYPALDPWENFNFETDIRYVVEKYKWACKWFLAIWIWYRTIWGMINLANQREYPNNRTINFVKRLPLIGRLLAVQKG